MESGGRIERNKEKGVTKLYIYIYRGEKEKKKEGKKRRKKKVLELAFSIILRRVLGS